MTKNKKVVKCAPMLHKIAKKDGVDLSQVRGTGKNGTITKADYETHVGRSVEAPATAERHRDEDIRSPMNHLTDDTRHLEIGGMKFNRNRASLDGSTRKTVDIPENCKNNDLHYRVVTDDKGKIQAAKNIGYQEVGDKMINPDTGEKIETRYRMGTKKDGSDLYGYLMATPKQWKQERDEKAEEIRLSREQGMFQTPQDDKGNPLGEEFYNKNSRME